MPKTYITRQQKLNNDLSAWIYGNMKVQKVSQKQLADLIGIKQPSLNYKLKHGNYTFSDLAVIFGTLKPDVDTLARLMGVNE